MVSSRMIELLGRQYGIDPERIGLSGLIRDFTDDQIMEIGKARQPRTIWALINALAEGADPETNAHLRGWDTYEEQLKDLKAARAMREQMRVKTKEREYECD